MSQGGNSPADAGVDGRRRTLVAAAGTIVAGLAGGATAAAQPAAPRADGAPGIEAALLTHAGAAHLGAYLRALAASPAVARVRVADPDGAIFDEARAVLGGKLALAERDAAAVLAAGRPRMALVSMEGARAPAAIRAALERGCHVLAEKPACTSAEEFVPLAALADRRGLSIALALANRLNPEVVEARRRVAAGAIGRPMAVEMHLVQDQTRLTRPDYQRSWFADRARAGGGHLAWLGIHWLDLAMHLVGEPIESVSAFTANRGGQPVNIEDSAVLAFAFGGGALGTLASGYWLDAGFQSHLRIWGSAGWLSIDAAPEAVLRVHVPGGAADGEVVRTAAGGDAYGVFVDAVADAVGRDAAPPVTTEESLRVVKTVFAAYRADAAGGRVAVE
jgi:predicted dehydrogenase